MLRVFFRPIFRPWGVRTLSTAREGWVASRKPSRAKPTRLSKLTPGGIRYLLRTLPSPIEGRVSHLRETPVESWVVNLHNEKVGIVPLEKSVFSQPIRQDIVHEVVRWNRACDRQGTASAKNRAEVAGSGRKMWAQKGSGRARQGDRRAPHIRGGGVVHPPKPRSFYYRLPIQIRRKGMSIALSAKLNEGNLSILDTVEFPTHRTRELISVLQKWPAYEQGKRVLLVHEKDEMDPNFVLASRNLPLLNICSHTQLRCIDLVRSSHIILTLRALEKLQAALSRKSLHFDRIQFPAPTLHLFPTLNKLDPIATANRNAYLESLSPADRALFGGELIKIGEQKHIKIESRKQADGTTANEYVVANGPRPSLVPGESEDNKLSIYQKYQIWREGRDAEFASRQADYVEQTRKQMLATYDLFITSKTKKKPAAGAASGAAVAKPAAPAKQAAAK